MLDDARGFDGNITQPRTQTAFSATASYSVLDAAGWAAKNQAADRWASAQASAEETRRQVAISAAQAYLAVIAAERQQRDRAPQPRHGAGARGVRAHAARGRPGKPPQPRAVDAGAGERRGPAAARRADGAPGPGGAGRRRVRRRPRGCQGRARVPVPRRRRGTTRWLDARPDVRLFTRPARGGRPRGVATPGRTGCRPSPPPSRRATSRRRASSSPRRRGARSSSWTSRSTTARCARTSACGSPTARRPGCASTGSRSRRAPSCASPRRRSGAPS